jgi:hypothetical protein
MESLLGTTPNILFAGPHWIPATVIGARIYYCYLHFTVKKTSSTRLNDFLTATVLFDSKMYVHSPAQENI